MDAGRRFTLTLDGSRGVGKSTLAAGIRTERGYAVIDVGALFRFLVYMSVKDRLLLDGTKAIALLSDSRFGIDYNKNSTHSACQILWDGQLLDKELWLEVPARQLANTSENSEIQRAVSLIVRQTRDKVDSGLVLVGRNTGSEIYPEADLKLELRASERVRLLRKGGELGLMAEKIDDTEPDISLVKITRGQVIIDTTELTPPEVLRLALQAMDESIDHGSKVGVEQVGLDELQKRIVIWQKRNFGEVPLEGLVLGLCGETGELAQAVLKRKRNLLNRQIADELIKDSIADVLVFLFGIASSEGISMRDVIDIANAMVDHRSFGDSERPPESSAP